MKRRFLAFTAAAAMTAAGCSKSATSSRLAYAAGESHRFSATTSFLTAGADGSVASAATLDELKARYRAGAFQVLPWAQPSGSAGSDLIEITSTSVDASLDSDLFVSDAGGRVLASSASPSGVEVVRNLRVDSVAWPMQIFIGAYGPSGKVSQVNISATITGTESASASSLDASVAQMGTLCGRASGTFLARGTGSRCECGGSVVTFDRFVADVLGSRVGPDQAFFAACNSTSGPSDAALVGSMQTACKTDGGTFLARSTGSRCECGAAVITFARFKRDFAAGGQVDDAAFAAACGGATTQATDPVVQFRDACLANLGAGAIMSGFGTQLSCECRGSKLFFAGFKSGYLDAGKTADDYQNDCAAQLQR